MNNLDFDLPPEMIAQQPPPRRQDARLLLFERASGAIRHDSFSSLPSFFRPGDLLVLNDTKVLPFRLAGRKLPGGGRVELLLLSREAEGRWRALIRPGRRLREGAEIDLGGPKARTLERTPAGDWRIEISPGLDLDRWLAEKGLAPLPPYIRRDIHDYPEEMKKADRERYQTVFAARPGSVAAPTAGLHFTAEILDEISRAGTEIVYVTLDVGWGTFRPLRPEDFERGALHPEGYSVSPSVADSVNRALAESRRIWLVGTTVVRTLESAFSGGRIRSGEGRTDLFIRPGYRFKLNFNLVTNFHLPGSSLILLAAALLGEETVGRIYREAIGERYRFYSFGDAMAVL